MLSKLKALWRGLPEGVKRVIHTFYQAFGGVLLAGAFAAHSSGDVKGLVIAAGAAGIAAVKALVVARG